MGILKNALRPVASLYLTVPLLACSILLVFAGTWAQRLMGIDDVVAHYFRSWVARIDPRIFAPGMRPGRGPSHDVIPFFGGKLLVLLLLINLLAAHSVRFKMNWKRSGILLIHFSLIMLLVSELISGYWAKEQQVQLVKGQSSSFTYDIRKPELAVIDQSSSDHDSVTVIGASMLKSGAVIDSPKLPFQVRIDSYFRNSDVLGPAQAAKAKVQPRATAGEDAGLALLELPPEPGTDSEKVDMPSAYVTLVAGEQNLGTYLLSTDLLSPQHVTFNGKTYAIALRFERFYKPYTLTLLHFAHDKYLGSDEPKNFSSRVRLVDAARHVDREVLIWMNHPLRYAGDTIYQEGFGPGDKYTTLQVASSPTSSWAAPLANLPGIGPWLSYMSVQLLACFIGAAGLLIHFGMHLVGFLRRKLKSSGPVPSQSSEPRRSGNYQLAPTTPPLFARASFWLSSFVLMLGATVVAVMAVLPAVKHSEPYNLEEFGKLPVVSEGRVLPIDSLARNTLRIVSGHETLTRDKQSLPAVQWILDAFTDSPKWHEDKIFRIDHPDIVGMLHLDAGQKYFSANDLAPHLAELSHQSEIANQVDQAERDAFQSKVLQLFESVRLVEKVVGGFERGQTYVVPPTSTNADWMTLAEAAKQAQKTGKVPEAAVLFTKVIDDYSHQRPASFNADLHEYQNYLQTVAPRIDQKSRFEAYDNAFDPFMACIVLYVIVLILGFASWLGWRKPLTAASLSLLAFTFLVHSFGLGARIWLQGRPPVTNLYSSAVFIGWGVVLLCIFLELLWRNGIASVVAATIGFVTLVIALHLSSDATLQPNGDTMAVLRAVLDTNLWLATHVVCITLGYASTFLAGTLAIVYVIRGVATPSLDADLRKSLARMVYGIVCFAMFFSFVGTILGGIWADQSWGRFWGWDPKENGAILIVLWNALILHARWSGMVRERGMVLLAVFGNVVTSWSWFGTNMLGIGLHSYGFMDAAVPWLVSFDVFQILMIGMGLLPMRFWRSVDSPSTARGFEPRVPTA
jgi:ABC-type transport system involved in cytochrome c biogenesis permease subunit